MAADLLLRDPGAGGGAELGHLGPLPGGLGVYRGQSALGGGGGEKEVEREKRISELN